MVNDAPPDFRWSGEIPEGWIPPFSFPSWPYAAGQECPEPAYASPVLVYSATEIVDQEGSPVPEYLIAANG